MCNGTITKWIVGLPPPSSSPELSAIHIQLKHSTGLITTIVNMDTSIIANSINNVYNFTTSVEVHYGDVLVINGSTHPIYCQKFNGPPNYWIGYNESDNTTLLHLNDSNYYPLISVIIGKWPFDAKISYCNSYFYTEPTTTDTIIPTDILSSSNNIPQATATLTLESNINDEQMHTLLHCMAIHIHTM